MPLCETCRKHVTAVIDKEIASNKKCGKLAESNFEKTGYRAKVIYLQGLRRDLLDTRG